MRTLVLLGFSFVFSAPAFATPTLRACAAADPLPVGVNWASTTATGASVASDMSGYHATVSWTASTTGPNYYIYRGTGNTYIVSSGSGASTKRCVVFEDSLGEISALTFQAPATDNMISIAPYASAVNLTPIRTAGLHLFVFGRRGTDQLLTGNDVVPNLYAYLVGGSGDDTIVSAAGVTCAMGSSRDGVTIGGEQPDYTRSFASEEARFKAECVPAASPAGFPDLTDFITLNGDWAWAWGGEGADTINGTEGDDELHGELSGAPSTTGLGSDVIYGNGGDDMIRAGASVDILFGGEGNDVFVADKGADLVFGEEGDDILFGDDGDDELWGGPGEDQLSGGGGDDLLMGEDDDDMLCGGSENDSYDAGGGADAMFHTLTLGLDYTGLPFPQETPLYSDAGPEAGQDCSDFSHDQNGLGVFGFGDYPAVGTEPAGTCFNSLGYDPADEFVLCPNQAAHPFGL